MAREHPGGIDFSTIFEEPEGEPLKEISLKFTWQNHQLREKAVEGQDFLLVDTAVFETLFSTYGAKGEKANFKDFTRFGKEQEDGECVVELRLKKLQLLAFPDKTKFKIEYSDEIMDLITKLLEKDKSKRLGSNGDWQEVLQHSIFNNIDLD